MADRTLKTFDYISKGLLPLDDSLFVERGDARRTNTGPLRARGEWAEKLQRGNWRLDRQGRGERQSEEEERLDEMVGAWDSHWTRKGKFSHFFRTSRCRYGAPRARLVASSCCSVFRVQVEPRNPLAACIYRGCEAPRLCLNSLARFLARRSSCQKRLSKDE